MVGGHGAIITTGAPHLKLLQPLDRCGASTRYGGSGDHEEYAGQQRQDKEDTLGVHRKCSSVEVEGLRGGK